ncbi:oxygen-independent coproporphyrinogen-3 oxidase [Tumebacillus sp. BK434]|uniref:radical SAM family heme chaperone HemW n=1 Tax=Tumebacillus sp. BK434 TaxID=2512169 RepID=UPI0010460184|nr:radical SAM family heme chaperone HemW [Tumebacillus sp. BK434]TCP53301.1 oxygen-independent coproporphyrinogen-3 oxidase [Tumebacillus sp. BK434]
MRVSSLYVHIPFCASKCYYCDFNSYVSTSDVMDRYLDGLDREMELVAAAYDHEPLQTVFFGGGTPTMFDARQTERMMQMLHRHFPLREGVEISVEANPGTVDPDKLSVLKDHGANRLSFGVQSFENDLLVKLGRLHDRDAVYRSWELARQAGFNSINLDLMFGLPGQTLEALDRTLRALIDLGPEHVSSYSLKVEEGTPFYTWHNRGQLILPPEEEETQMYQMVIDGFRGAGYEMYEISNFAKPGHRSRHNQVYWRNEPYMAVGSGAHGYVGGLRYINQKNVPEYIETTVQGGRPVVEQEVIDERMQQEDTMILGLRLMEGVSFARFRDKHGVAMQDVFGDILLRFEKLGLLQVDAAGVRLTQQGIFLANEVYAAFLE